MITDTPAARMHQLTISEEATERNVARVEQSTSPVLARIGGIAAPAGAILLFVTSMLHPTSADPSDHHAAFSEYAADSLWIWSHLGQFLGLATLAIALGLLAMTLEAGRPAAWGRIGLFGSAALVTLAAVLQAVDGIALKMMVDRWAGATGEAQAIAYEATLAVREIETGLASFLSLVSALTLIVIGLAVIFSRRYPTWLGVIGLVAGLGTMAGGVAQATTGFSDLAMALSMSASVVLLLWAVVAGVLMWRLAPRLANDRQTS